MENYKNLLEIVEKSDEEITWYLEDVTVEQFKKDVLQLAKMNTDKQLISELIKKLQQMMGEVITSGTAGGFMSYGVPNNIIGKTGTTQNNSDGWFMGFVPNLSTGVWVGCEDRAARFGNTALGQGALRNVIEEFSNNVRFILTGNFLNKIITPILSRCIAYKIEPPIGEFAKRCANILKQENILACTRGELII
jgi:membrane carboxypeptidase/penicillin-binding protein